MRHYQTGHPGRCYCPKERGAVDMIDFPDGWGRCMGCGEIVQPRPQSHALIVEHDKAGKPIRYIPGTDIIDADAPMPGNLLSDIFRGVNNITLRAGHLTGLVVGRKGRNE